MIIGYARVSTDDQKLDPQTDALEAAGAECIFADKITGTKRTRPQLDLMINQLRQGDVVVVAKYDRLARSRRSRSLNGSGSASGPGRGWLQPASGAGSEAGPLPYRLHSATR